MSRLIKEKIVEQYTQTFRGVSDVAVVKAEGVGVKDMTTFRRTLRAHGIRAMRVQNRLSKRAFAAAGLAGIDTLLVGPSTLIWGGGIVEIAKVLAEEGKTFKALEIRGGVTDGQVLSKDDVDALAKLPSREALIG
ncbi:MAG: 50S ribosomal protein L10, partial [Acidobacteria bacterium]|nr:50S ribosomal protein L10 [Acidobacteriota bacterium]